ncbi:MAG: autotransporter domain-containing protein [Planctomycetaceae bacterium]|nr:autotransporter domain-containing protein [Planctomycetaceae bacterium]
MWALLCKTLPGLAISVVLAILFNTPLQAERPKSGGQSRGTIARPSTTLGQPSPAASGRSYDSVNPIFTGVPIQSPATQGAAALPIPPSPEPEARLVKGPWSSNALASMAMPVSSEYCPPPPPPHVGTHYMELPAKGIYAWADGEAAKTTLKKSRNSANAFDVDRKTYSLGLKYDWSIDSVIGVSISRLEADVESRRQGDTRRNEVRGTVFTGHYDGYLFGKYPLTVQGSYGRLDMDGDGTVGGYRWREDERQSDYYALSATFGVPLIFRNRFKLLTEIGIDYRKLKTGGYAYTVNGTRFAAPGMTSESLLIPFDFTVKWDYPQVWGFLTTYAGCGLAVELDGSATGVRAWNASSASASHYTPGPPIPMVSNSGYDEWKSLIGTVALGVEAKTVGGWELRADYRRTMASGFAENRFSLELGRCF